MIGTHILENLEGAGHRMVKGMYWNFNKKQRDNRVITRYAMTTKTDQS